MYWGGNDYDKMAQLVVDIYLDYNIVTFPVDEKVICRKMGIKVVPYSEYDEQDRLILMKKSPDGFYKPPTISTPPTVFYNDTISSYGRQRYSIFHEVKHFANNDKDDDIYSDNMADYFSRYFMCPIPYLIYWGINDEMTLISDHLVSQEAARNTIKNVKNRTAKYGKQIFDYEQPLIDLLFPPF